MTDERLRGVFRASDVADDVHGDWERGIEPGAAAGWSLDELLTWKKRQMTVMTGIPGDGKSTFMDNTAIRLAHRHSWRILFCSPENQPIQRHVESLVEIHAGKKFCNPEQMDRFPERAVTADELAYSAGFIDDFFRFICPEETDFHVDYILELARQIKHDPVDPFDFDGLVLDPYNELEHKRPPNMSETEYISSMLSKFRRFARSENCHVWIVAHPQKLTPIAPSKLTEDDLKTQKFYPMPSLYDIAGSAHWRNKADNGVVVYRNRHLKPETTTVSVQKVRFRECGTMGQKEFFYDYLCNRFVEREDELLFARSGGRCE